MAYNEELNRQIKQLELSKEEQMAIVNEYKNVFFGKGVKIRKEAQITISNLNDKIADLNSQMH